MPSFYINDHLWDFDLAASLARLSAQRREQALKFRHEFGQRACVAAYLLLCEGLEKEYGLKELPIFDYHEHGKPFIKGHPEIHFNLSHCQEAAVCCVSNKPVGVDVESIRSFSESLVAYTMNEHEVASIQASKDPARQFIRLWTQKEALMKLTGQGITNHLKEVLCRDDIVLSTVESRDGRYIYSIAVERE